MINNLITIPGGILFNGSNKFFTQTYWVNEQNQPTSIQILSNTQFHLEIDEFIVLCDITLTKINGIEYYNINDFISALNVI